MRGAFFCVQSGEPGARTRELGQLVWLFLGSMNGRDTVVSVYGGVEKRISGSVPGEALLENYITNTLAPINGGGFGAPGYSECLGAKLDHGTGVEESLDLDLDAFELLLVDEQLFLYRFRELFAFANELISVFENFDDGGASGIWRTCNYHFNGVGPNSFVDLGDGRLDLGPLFAQGVVVGVVDLNRDHGFDT